ncbi:hypothetical protein [Sphingomonas lacusdianchii]|uniref:hypothetical protein n=1 Tax=Sphingomonas lacusdianchii TaxID=2917992 RepID=UPI001F5629B5|nr:hypothetical protein [Sphingomonas sp. JXJ CY 53]
MNPRQPDLFYGDKQPPRTVPPSRAYRRPEKTKPKGYAWESMGAWVRHMHRLFAMETPSSDHYSRTRATARELTVERIRLCRHDDDLARCEDMLVRAFDGWLYGLDRAFTRAERGTLLVEVRNRRTLLAMGRTTARPKGARFDPTKLPDEALDRLIQHHRDIAVVDQLRAERTRRAEAASATTSGTLTSASLIT